MLPCDVQDANWQHITGKYTLEKPIYVVDLERYEGLTMEEQEGLVHGAFRVELHMAVLEILPGSFGVATVDYKQSVAQEQLAALRRLVNTNPTWCWTRGCLIRFTIPVRALVRFCAPACLRHRKTKTSSRKTSSSSKNLLPSPPVAVERTAKSSYWLRGTKRPPPDSFAEDATRVVAVLESLRQDVRLDCALLASADKESGYSRLVGTKLRRKRPFADNENGTDKKHSEVKGDGATTPTSVMKGKPVSQRRSQVARSQAAWS